MRNPNFELTEFLVEFHGFPRMQIPGQANEAPAEAGFDHVCAGTFLLHL